MSGQDIIIAQLRADVERLRERAEKAERFIATADSEWKSRAEKAERERDEERHLADVRGEMLTKTERERDEARAERDARPAISAEDAAHAVQFFRGWDAPGSVTDNVFAALRAHAQKAVKP